MHRSPLLTALLTLLPLMAGASAATLTPAGTIIQNQATGTVRTDDPADGTLHSVSNAVQSTVASVCSVSLLPNGSVTSPAQTQTVRVGDTATYWATVTNAGNDTFTFPLSWQPVSGVTPAASSVKFFQDLNGNRALDSGEPEISSLTLAQDRTVNVLMIVAATAAMIGEADFAPVTACAEGIPDADNVVHLKVTGEAHLLFTKSMTPAALQPGAANTVTLDVANTGDITSDAVVIEDLLGTQALSSLSFEPGSVNVPGGRLTYTSDGTTWTDTPGNAVTGLRWTLPQGVPAHGSSRLTFRLRAAATAAPGLRTNTATLTPVSPDLHTPTGAAADATATLNVAAAPALALGPVGNPGAPELSEQDTQRRQGVVTGQLVCFTHTLLNSGNVSDLVSLTPTVAGGLADITLLNAQGTALQQPLTLTAGQSVNVQVCVTPRSAGQVTLTLTASSSAGAEPNQTVDVISGILDQGPTLSKTVTPTGTVSTGHTLTFTLSVTNPYPFPLTNVTVTDTLTASLALASATGTPSVDGPTLTWHAGTLAPAETVSYTVTARVATTAPDDQAITNCFTFTSDQHPQAVTSPCTSSPVWSAALFMQKTAQPQQVTVGGRLTYTLTAKNTSATASMVNLTVMDALPATLEYVPGTSRIAGQSVPDPAVQNGALVWAVPELAAGQQVTITFDTRVLPGAPADLVNTVTAQAQGLNLGSVIVNANTATAHTKIQATVFDVYGDLIGRVFVDRNLNRRYEPGTDQPVGNARIVLSTGRTVVTDATGLYHVARLEGPVALRLDPNSVPYTPLSVPQDGGLNGSRLVVVSGLTSADFPLTPLTATLGATRDTRLTQGPLTVDKHVTANPDGSYAVSLTLTTQVDLAAFTLTDPLPTGATLTEGTSTLDVTALNAGTTHVTYRFTVPGTPAVTDPTVHWRTP
ncbi:DUF11 domain-containing protein [Deinococcus taeanensis]|uniref:DUF7927 domain-containing protein n=1 Tax=Deinococcus taeanensis TaxID=2737050 RepID=UPI001CDCB629|nr:DUF11 domain-containing protein [Deinococcus taeanensis]UBV41690.1 DUF11 domain-containing protein [Deinococcus taeanensis]